MVYAATSAIEKINLEFKPHAITNNDDHHTKVSDFGRINRLSSEPKTVQDLRLIPNSAACLDVSKSGSKVPDSVL